MLVQTKPTVSTPKTVFRGAKWANTKTGVGKGNTSLNFNKNTGNSSSRAGSVNSSR